MPYLTRPGATYFITRRCEHRRFLLRPDRKMNQLFRWVLAVTADEVRVQVHAAACMSTHYHLVVTAKNSCREDSISHFLQLLNARLANAIQVLRGWSHGVVWAPGKVSKVDLVTPQAIVEKIAYTLANPVAAGLVHRHQEWPGVTQRVRDLGRASIEDKKPDFYFTSEGWPEFASVPLTFPEAARVLGDDDDIRALIADELERCEEQARLELREAGCEVLGAPRVMKSSPFRCATSYEQRGELNPTFAAGRGQKEDRLRAIARLRAFREEYAEAKARWCAGDRDVIFPAGTYWMVVHHGAKAHPFP